LIVNKTDDDLEITILRMVIGQNRCGKMPNTQGFAKADLFNLVLWRRNLCWLQ